MKRFYCSICKKIKRVRIMPSSVQQVNATNPTQRVGQCRFHSGDPRHIVPLPKPKPVKTAKPVVAKPKKSRNKGQSNVEQ